MHKIVGVFALGLLGACSGSDASTVDAGLAGTRSFTVGTFDAVSLLGSDDVKIVTGTTPGVVASGPADQLDKLEITVDGSTLRIGRKRDSWGVNWSSGPGVNVTVTTPGIRAASIAGSGDMSVDKARGPEFKGSIGGSGDLDVADIDVGKASISIAGSGNVRAAGKATTTDFSIVGSGDIDAERLVSQAADISIAGSGNLRVTATGKAKISLVGSGDAIVKGTKDCSVSSIGSGEARCTS